jgi:hypothetical protein
MSYSKTWEECSQHQWKERQYADGGENWTCVICTLCGMPGERNDDTGDVYYPAS